MNSKFPIEVFKFLRARKLKQLKLIRNGRLYLRTVYTLTGPTINLNFDLIKNMTYEEAINIYNKTDSNNINSNEYQMTIIDKSELDRS
jgi:hypothetical protein